MRDRLTKSNDEWIDGVIGGIGDYLGVSNVLLRVLVLIGVLFLEWHFLVPVYIILMIIMPEAPKTVRSESEVSNEENQHQRKKRSGQGMQILGIILVIVGVYYLLTQALDFSFDFLYDYFNTLESMIEDLIISLKPSRDYIFSALLIGIGLWIVYRNKK